MIPVYVFTNDHHLWLLRGFSYLWNEFGGQGSQVVIVGYAQPDFPLPLNFRFLSLGKQQPKERWSDSLIEFLGMIGHLRFVLMLEDYWLTAPIDPLAPNNLVRFVDDDVLSLDLSGTRASKKQAKTVTAVYGYELVSTPTGTPYQMSFQAAIWNKPNLLKILKAGENPWQAEIEGTKRVNASGLRVLGVRPAALKYQPVWRSQKQKWQLDKIPADKLEHIKRQGWLNGQ